MGGPIPVRTSLAVLDENTCEPCRSRHGQRVGVRPPPHRDCENPDGCRCTCETWDKSVAPAERNLMINLDDRASIVIGGATITGRVAAIATGPGTIDLVLVSTNLEAVKVERVTVLRVTEASS